MQIYKLLLLANLLSNSFSRQCKIPPLLSSVYSCIPIVHVHCSQILYYFVNPTFSGTATWSLYLEVSVQKLLLVDLFLPFLEYGLTIIGSKPTISCSSLLNFQPQLPIPASKTVPHIFQAHIHMFGSRFL